jgi:arylsulfatase
MMDATPEYAMQIIVAGYTDLACARRDFAELNAQVKQRRFRIREAVLITKEDDDTPRVIETYNHHGRAGAGVGASIGALVGLIAPPLLAGVALGAAAGLLVAKFADHSLKSGLRHEIGQTLKASTGVIIAMSPEINRYWVEQALAGSQTTSVLDFEHSTIASLEEAVAEAMTTVNPVAAQQPGDH